MENHNEKQTETHYRLPRIGESAPQFEAVSTQGTLNLKDYEGKWVILFSQPADFTPVCTTEFLAFSNIHDQLRAMNCELIGLSIDSLFSHIAWVRNIENLFDTKIPFPIIADINKDIAYKYGMVMPEESDTTTARCVFVIDAEQVVRAMIYYPFTTGRNMDEILRLIRALQTADQHGVGTGANWQPGDKVILYPPLTQDSAQDRVENTSAGCTAWYFCEKSLD